MGQTFHIGEISDFFQVPASTLRYWEEAGLISPAKNCQNDYREYSVEQLMTISDVLFYKSLGLSLKQIGRMKQMEVPCHRQLLEKKTGELEQQKRQIDRQIQKLQYHLSAIDALHELEENPFQLTEIDTECIVPFELIEIEKLKQYIGNPYLYSRVQHSGCLEKERRGITIPLRQGNLLPPDQILWKKTETRYIVCLMKEEITKDYPNNLKTLLDTVLKSHKTGYIISRFLLCAQENGKQYDFYKTFIEIL